LRTQITDAYRQTQKERAAFERVRFAERQFAVQLRKIARHIGDLVQQFNPGDPQQLAQMVDILRGYSETIKPWSRSVSRRLLAEVARRDERAWRQYSRLMGVEMQRQITQSSVGHVMHQLMNEQVSLITSLPTQAAQRVHELAIQSRYEGGRASEIAQAIMETGNVTKARANLIARTETSRAATTFAQARAQSIGSEGYIWRTARDRRVRKLHRELEGTFHRWSDPPVAGENGERAHAGAIYNCRCFPEPVLPAIY
jgi:SPP1 gp7 family putative phage head morphogenesis protein